MEAYQLNLKNFETEICKSWKKLQKDDNFHDVTLACDDKQIKAHKVILSSCSSIFTDILKLNPHQHPLIYLKGVNYSQLQNLVDFIYQGVVKIPNKELEDFLAIGQEFKIKGLSDNEKETEHDLLEDVVPHDIKNVLQQGNVLQEGIMKEDDSKDDLSLDEMETKYDSLEEDAVPHLIKSILQHDIMKEDNSTKEDDSLKNDEMKKGVVHAMNTNEQTKKRRIENEPMNFDGNNEINSKKETNVRNRENIAKNVINPEKENNFQNRENITSQTSIKQENFMIEGRNYVCQKCNQQYTHETSLKRHIDSVHDMIRHACTYCDHRAATKSSLKIHIKGVHEKVKYSCDQCDYKATTNSSLKVHIDAVHLMKRYPCHSCDYTSGHKQTLKRHVKSHAHTFEPK